MYPKPDKRPVSIYCCTDGNFYYISDGQQKNFDKINSWHGVIDAKCDQSRIVGGHVIMNSTEAAIVKKGGQVHILPICNVHNTAVDMGAGFYMRLAAQTTAVKLKNYMEEVNEYMG